MKKSIKKRINKKKLPFIVRKHHLEAQYNSGKLIIDVGIDPQNINEKVTRLRRKCVYDEMMNRGSISVTQRNCAERYAILCEKAFGQSSSIYARISHWLKEGKISGGNWEPIPSQHDAYSKLLSIWQEIGRYHLDILNMIILGNMKCKEISQLIITKKNIASFFFLIIFFIFKQF